MSLFQITSGGASLGCPLPGDPVCVQPGALAMALRLIRRCQAGPLPPLLAWGCGRDALANLHPHPPPIISPGWWWGTLALNPSAEPRCHPAAARHGCHPKATSGCVPRSRDRLLPAVGTRGELRARCAPRLPGRLRNLPPQLFSAECVATGENSRTVYLLAQICLPPVWLQGQACRLGPGKWGGVFASKKAGRASTAGRHPAQPCCAPQTAASPGALDPIQDTGEEALVTF